MFIEMRGVEVKRRTRTHGLATGLDLMSSRERTRRFLAIEGAYRFSFLGSRVAMFIRSL